MGEWLGASARSAWLGWVRRSKGDSRLATREGGKILLFLLVYLFIYIYLTEKGWKLRGVGFARGGGGARVLRRSGER